MIFGSLVSHSIVRYFQTREAVSAAGLNPGEFDLAKPAKHWIVEDTKGYAPDEDGMVTFFGIALAKDGRTPRVDVTGNPYGANFKVPFEELTKFNIPDKKIGELPDAKVTKEYQLPLRSLAKDEKFAFTGFGIPIVARISEVPPLPVGPPVVATSPLESKVDFLTDLVQAKFDLLFAMLQQNKG